MPGLRPGAGSGPGSTVRRPSGLPLSLVGFALVSALTDGSSHREATSRAGAAQGDETASAGLHSPSSLEIDGECLMLLLVHSVPGG